jgi:hypothetical protein
LITGEALMGILIAIPIVAAGKADVLALPVNLQFGEVVGLVIFAVIGYLLYRVALKARCVRLTSSSSHRACRRADETAGKPEMTLTARAAPCGPETADLKRQRQRDQARHSPFTTSKTSRAR